MCTCMYTTDSCSGYACTQKHTRTHAHTHTHAHTMVDNAINKYSLHLEVSTDNGVRGHVSSTLSEDAAAKMSSNSDIALV